MTSEADVWLERLAVSDTVARYFAALDEFDWDTIESLLAERVTLITGLPQVPPRTLDRQDFLTDLKARNGGFAATFHVHSGHVVDIDGDKASVRANMIASHIVEPGTEDWFGGYGVYRLKLVRGTPGWLLSSLEIITVHQLGGDPGKLYARAAERMRSGAER